MQDISFEFAQREVRDRYNVNSRADLEALQASLARQRDKNVLKALGQALSAQADDTEYDNIANSTSAEELRAIVQVLADRHIAALTLSPSERSPPLGKGDPQRPTHTDDPIIDRVSPNGKIRVFDNGGRTTKTTSLGMRDLDGTGDTENGKQVPPPSHAQHVLNLLPVGAAEVKRFRDEIPLGSQSGRILETYFRQVSPSVIYKPINVLHKDVDEIVKTAAWPRCQTEELFITKEFAKCELDDVVVRDRPKGWSPSAAALQKEGELRSKASSLRQRIVKFALPAAEAARSIADVLAELRQEALAGATFHETCYSLLLSVYGSEVEEWDDQTRLVRTLGLLEDRAALASDRVTLWAHLWLTEEAAVQGERFINLQPQDSTVLESAYGLRAPRGAAVQVPLTPGVSQDVLKTSDMSQLAKALSALSPRRQKPTIASTPAKSRAPKKALGVFPAAKRSSDDSDRQSPPRKKQFALGKPPGFAEALSKGTQQRGGAPDSRK